MELAYDRSRIRAEVARHACRDRPITLDCPRPVGGAPGPRFIAVREPAGDDRRASLQAFIPLVPRVVPVARLLAEQGADRFLVVGSPRLDVVVEPALEGGVIHGRHSTPAPRQAGQAATLDSTTMRVLLVGSGGREHALAWKLASSPMLTELHAAPGNPGIARLAACHPIRAEDAESLLGLARSLGIELVVVGPEVPLVVGLADVLRRFGIAVFGPGKRAAAIEGSKSFAKDVMAVAGVPTAAPLAIARPPCVIKADGLAAGKGVYVCRTEQRGRCRIARGELPRRQGRRGGAARRARGLALRDLRRSRRALARLGAGLQASA